MKAQVRFGKAIVGVALSGMAFAAAPALAGEDPHIAGIEHDLRPIVQVKGRPIHPATLADSMAAHHVPAVSIAVIDHGRIVWAKAYGYAELARKAAATPKTVFQAGSISKPVAASAAMQLVQAGRLDLDAPANTQLKSWQIPASPFTATRPVTLRGLLTHTAGMTVHGFPGYAAGDPVPTIVQVLEGKPPANTGPVVVDVTPGTIWRYSGGGITVAQLMMTDATGEAFPALLRRSVFEPLGMTSSTYEQPLPATRDAAAAGYLPNGDPVVGRFHTYPEMAAAGLWTTPTDLAKWVIALQRAYDGRSETLMKRATAKAMLTPGLGQWGLGIEVEGAGDARRFSHGGDDWGFKAQMVGYMTGGRGIVAMANGDGGMAVIQPLVQAVARAYGWKGMAAEVIVARPMSEADKRALVGRYGEGAFPFSIELDGGKLWGRDRGGDRMEIVPTANGRLRVPDAGFGFGVARKDGAVIGLKVGNEIMARAP
jgi:CubicO group peptidase (beta-lactamase class C family)